MADVGTGTTVAFGTSSFTAEVMSVAGNDITREDIDVTHMGSTNYREFIPSDLVDGGTIEMEINFDPDDQPPITAAPETITITFPVPSGSINGADVEFTGYVNSWSWNAPLEDKLTATITIKVDGVTTEPTWTDAS